MGAVVVTVNITVTVALPAAICGGENEQLLSGGKCEQEYVTALAKLGEPTGAKLNVYCAGIPGLTVRGPVLLLNWKSAPTFRAAAAEWDVERESVPTACTLKL